jgi:hypothetical protein
MLQVAWLASLLSGLAGAQTLAPVGQSNNNPQVQGGRGLVVVTPKEVQIRRREYTEAYQDYQTYNDAALFDDLLNHPEKEAELKKRIQDQLDRTKKMLDSQGRYYESVRGLYNQVYEAVSKPAGGTNTEEDKKRLQEISDGLFEQRRRLEEENAKEPSVLIKKQYGDLITSLRKAEDANREYQRLLDALNQNATDAEQARTKALASQTDVIAAFDELAKDSRMRAAQAEKRYNSYLLVAGHKAIGVTPPPPPPPQPTGPVTAANPVTSPAGTGSQPSQINATGDPAGPKVVVVPKPDVRPLELEGHWEGSGATKLRVAVDIHESGARITGRFEAFEVPRNVSNSGRITADFEGDKSYSTLSSSYSFGLGDRGKYGTVEIISPKNGSASVVWHSADGGTLLDGTLRRTGDARQ